MAQKSSRNSRSSYIRAFWTTENGRIATFEEMDWTPRPGIIQFFIKHSLTLSEESFEHWFAFCEWFLPVPDKRNKYGKPVEVWNLNHMENMGPASFIPVCRLLEKVVFTKITLQGNDLIVLIPRF